jgi:hypothetical protein
MKIEYKDGLIFTTIEIWFRNQSKIIDNIVIDTGASMSIISPDIVDDIGIFAEPKDRIVSSMGVGGSIHNSFEKDIDMIKIENRKINNIKLDFGIIDPNGEINGLLGLDVLMELESIIDLKSFEIRF